MSKIIEVKEGDQTLYVSDFAKHGGFKQLIDGFANALTGRHHLTEAGSKTVSTEKHSVHLSPDRGSAAQFGFLFRRTANNLAAQITSASRGSLRAEVVPAPEVIIG